MAKTVLIIEDEVILAENISAYLQRSQWETHIAHSAEEGLSRIETLQPDIVLTDYMMAGKTGLQVIKSALAIDPQLKIVMFTGEGSTQLAVEAMKAGACDYVSKPVALAELKLVLEKAVGQAQVEKTLSVFQRRESRGSLEAIIGQSPAMLATKTKLRQVLAAERCMSDDDLPAVLITGETGTGKELLARSLHFEGVRHNGPFIEINCASLPPNLLESELFGYERGAFTDAKERRVGLAEAAEGGTLFLDEIGEVEFAIQAKLLKLLEEKTVRRIGSVRDRKVNIRIVSATNRDLEKMVDEGRFRRDLYYRLRVISLSMPPLRGLPDDILSIAKFYLQRHAKRYGKTGLYFTAAAEAAMQRYNWPGNVRELRNMLEQTVLLAQGDAIAVDQLTFSANWNQDTSAHEPADDLDACAAGEYAGKKSGDPDQDMVALTLEKTDWNISKSAKLLGISRDMLRYRIEKFRFTRPE